MLRRVEGPHDLVVEMPRLFRSICLPCNNSGFGAFLKGFLWERTNATPVHIRTPRTACSHGYDGKQAYNATEENRAFGAFLKGFL